MIAEPARARMLAYLLSGHHASAGELAEAASVTPATASSHLAQLVDGGLLHVEPRGRHRYFRLADAEVAQALMALSLVAERQGHDTRWQRPQRQRLREARCCYGHLAGVLGVALHDRLQAIGALEHHDEQTTLTSTGMAWLTEIGFDPAQVPSPTAKARSRFAYPCLDWSERRDHLAGPLAKALLEHFIAKDWLRRTPGDRALQLTPAGTQLLMPHLQSQGFVAPKSTRGDAPEVGGAHGHGKDEGSSASLARRRRTRDSGGPRR